MVEGGVERQKRGVEIGGATQKGGKYRVLQTRARRSRKEGMATEKVVGYSVWKGKQGKKEQKGKAEKRGRKKAGKRRLSKKRGWVGEACGTGRWYKWEGEG